MKRIVFDYLQIDTVPLSEVLSKIFSSGSDGGFLCYETTSRNGLAVLITNQDDNGLFDKYGFCYHIDLLKNKRRRLKFAARTPRESVEKVIQSGRNVLFFESYADFAKHCSNYTKL